MKQTFLLFAFVVALCSLPNLAADDSGDWLQWRGPNRDGRSAETGLLKEWPDGGPPLVWKATGLGAGYSGVTLAGDRLFTMGEKENANFVIALNRADGKLLWTTQVGKAGAPGWGGFAGPRVIPTLDGERLYAVGQYGEAVCLQTATGQEVWRKDYIQDFGGKLPEWGYTGMPLVDGEQVILAPGGPRGNLVAVNKKTGDLVWQSQEFTDGIHYSSPIVVEIGGVRQYIQLTDSSVAGIAAADGRMLWRAARKGSVAVIPTPICHDGGVYVTSGYGAGSQMFKIAAADGKFSAEKVYDNKVMVNHHGGAVLIGQHVYGYSDGKGWTCQDFATGEMVWREKDKLGKGSLVYADGLLYCRAEDGKGTVVVLEATPEGYREKGRFDQPDRSAKNSWPHPVVAGGRLYIRDQDVLLCYDVRAK